jgi:RNA polymerase sigma-70 factor, ECF subfamily
MKALTLRLASPPERTDAALCQAFLAGDAAAFGELIHRHQDAVHRLVRRYARSPDEGRDLAQRSFLAAFEAARRVLPTMRAAGDEFPFRPWLLRIAINLAKNHLRDVSRWTQAPLEAVDRAGGEVRTAHDALERAQAEALTRRAVLALPRRQREVFGLRIDLGLPFAEVARVLGITEGNAKAHFHHAVKRLRSEVQALTDAPRGAP